MKDFYNKFIDITGKLLLTWFVYSTFKYFYVGRFLEEIRMVKSSLSYGFDWFFLYGLFKIPVAAIGVFVLIPMLINGRISGLILGIIYWVMGYLINPLWFLVPKTMQIGPDGRASSLLILINIFYSLVSLLILFAFFLYRRSLGMQQKDQITIGCR